MNERDKLLVSEIEEIVFDGYDRPDGVTIGTAYGVVAEKHGVDRRTVVSAWLEKET